MVDDRRRLSRCPAAAWCVVAVLLAVAAGCGGERSAADTTTRPERRSPGVAVEVGESVAPPTPVGPAAGSPLDQLDRDAGISVELSDGSIMWLFGDTAITEPDGGLRFFVIGTAAWAPADQPTVTQDHMDPSGSPVAFATPTADFPGCPADIPVSGMWPASAVTYRVGGLDRIVVWLENICLGDAARGTGVGMSVAELWYDPAHPPVGEPVTARILNQRLFPRRGFGLAATLGDDHDAYVYSCDAPMEGGWPTEYGPCYVAQVGLEEVHDPSAYRVWSHDGSWQPLIVADPAPLELPSAELTRRFPAGSVSVVRDPSLGGYVMVYSPWPVRSTELEVRVSASPQGPWSEPSPVAIEGCQDAVGGTEYNCYAATAQPAFSEPGLLGVGYYDRAVATAPVRGTYFVATVPVALHQG
jgi:hypothetical protein